MDLKVKNGESFLFMGDSITDCGRRGDFSPFGNGYVKITRDLFLSNEPAAKIKIINKGIGGNTIPDIRNRWEDDVVFHKPDWLSILIGINDIHKVLNKVEGWENFTPENFKNNYNQILERTVEKFPCKTILLEPFYLSVDKTNQGRGIVLKKLEEYCGIVQEMSEKFDTSLIRLQDIFQEQLKYRESETFCNEPVHPNLTGHIIIANSILKTIEA